MPSGKAYKAPQALRTALEADRGGGAKLYNSVVTELMQCIDQYRGATGFILMAATNFYDAIRGRTLCESHARMERRETQGLGQ